MRFQREPEKKKREKAEPPAAEAVNLADFAKDKVSPQTVLPSVEAAVASLVTLRLCSSACVCAAVCMARCVLILLALVAVGCPCWRRSRGGLGARRWRGESALYFCFYFSLFFFPLSGFLAVLSHFQYKRSPYTPSLHTHAHTALHSDPVCTLLSAREEGRRLVFYAAKVSAVSAPVA